MTLGVVSVSVITNQAAIPSHAIQTVGLSDVTPSKLFGSFKHLPIIVYAKSPPFGDKTIHFFPRRKRNSSPKIVLFAVSKESDELENGRSQSCTNDPMVTVPETNGSYKELQRESGAFILDLGAELLESAENLGNQESLLDKLKAVLLHVLAMEQWNASRLKVCHRSNLVGATNLMHYLALKSLDVELLKKDLTSFFLLNLETVNPCVLASLSATIQMLSNSLSDKKNIAESVSSKRSLDEQKEFTISSMMKREFFKRELLLGPLLAERSTHIMVTVGQEAAESETLISDLLKMGTTVIRINCAHGDPGVWSEIIRRVKRSAQMLEKPCRVLMDLAGPKLRTGKLKGDPCVMKITPEKNAFGDVIYPAHVWLSPQGSGPPPAHISPHSVLCVDGQEFLSKLEVGDKVRFLDARGKQRTLKVLKKFSIFAGVGLLTECTRTAYVQSGTELFTNVKKPKLSTGLVVNVPPVQQFVRLRVGDLLIISRDIPTAKNKSTSSSDGHRVTCPSGYLFDSVKPGEPIAFDDGKIWGVIRGVSTSEIIVSITHASPKGTKLSSEKSINIPESNIRFEGLTSKDLMDLDFVAAHADIVGISFVREVRDIVMLRQELAKRKLCKLGIVLKIETKGGFENLPLMLLEAMKSPNPLGVMIARGDLAVECGWEKLADIQEEIMSICSAAHVPVIWATQVLESLVKSGVPTRAEITDVANARRASCIMLNKGKHILEAVSTLDNILNDPSRKVKAELNPLLLSSHIN